MRIVNSPSRPGIARPSQTQFHTPSRGQNPAARLTAALLSTALLGGCAISDSRLAGRAKTEFVGMTELDLQACLGGPDQHSTFGSTDILTYYATSSSSTSYSLPIVGGIGLSNGGYCHATFRIDQGRVTHVIYSGEKNATLAPNAYCAPIFRSCITELEAHPRPPAPQGATVTPTASASSSASTAAGSGGPASGANSVPNVAAAPGTPGAAAR